MCDSTMIMQSATVQMRCKCLSFTNTYENYALLAFVELPQRSITLKPIGYVLQKYNQHLI